MVLNSTWPAEIRQRRQAVEGGRARHEEGVESRERGGLVFEGPQGGAEGLEKGRLRGHQQPGDLPAQVGDHGPVAGRAAHDHDVAAFDLLEQFEDLAGHHAAEAGGDLGAGDPLVRGVRAVRLAEHGAAAGHVVRVLLRRPLGGFLQAHVHAAQLLQKELPGPGGALVARDDVGDAPGAVENVDHEGLPAGRDHRRAVDPSGLQKGVGVLDRFRLRDGGQVDEAPELAAGGGDTLECGDVPLVQGPDEGALGVPLVDVQRVADDAGPPVTGFGAGPLQFHQGDGGRPQADPQRFLNHFHMSLRRLARSIFRLAVLRIQ